MFTSTTLRRAMTLLAAASVTALFAYAPIARAQEVVSGPAAEPECFVPWTDQTKFFKFPKKEGPYRIALANGFIGNTWRIQMIKTAKAYADQPEVAAKLKEFKVVSTGEDVAAQIAAVNNFIDSGYDAIVINAQNPTAFTPVIKRAKQGRRRAGRVRQHARHRGSDQRQRRPEGTRRILGALAGQEHPERRQDPRSARRRRHLGRHRPPNGIHEVLDASGKKWDIVEVVGKWDDGTAQKVTADAIAVQKKFDGITVQGGSTGTVRAFMDAGHPFVPVGGETENGFRKLCAAHGAEGLKCASGGTGPAQVAVAIKTAIAALEGQVVPQSVKLPLATTSKTRTSRTARAITPRKSDNFFVGNAFPTCGINFSAQEIMGQSEAERITTTANTVD